jgi:nicotinate-nucleotide pyrophosphorylase (carboxylating)
LLNDFIVKEHVVAALKEDIGFGDISTDFIYEGQKISVNLNTRENGVLCGLSPFRIVFETLGNVDIEFYFQDGQKITRGDCIAKISGCARSVLTGERLALNYIQRMSGIATRTRKFADLLLPCKAKIADTRKNTPNFRIFEKYAVKVGGGALHRFNLCDCVMLKDNHIALFGGSICDAVKKVRENISHAHKIEVECDTKEQVQQALEAGVDIIMLDNMPVCQMQECVALINGKATVEASGGVFEDVLVEIAKTGVDIISTSALVGAPTLDLGFDSIIQPIAANL